MIVDKDLAEFASNLDQEVLLRASQFEGDYQENAFTEMYLDYLCEAAEIDDWSLANYPGRGLKVNGYYQDDSDDGILTLFVSDFRSYSEGEVETLGEKAAEKQLERLKNFYQRSEEGLYRDLEKTLEEDGDESPEKDMHPVCDLAKAIYMAQGKTKVVKLVLLTNAVVKKFTLPSISEGRVVFVRTVWDIERMFRMVTSGSAREKIVVDLRELGCQPLEGVRTYIQKQERPQPDGSIEVSGDYATYLVLIPGKTLFAIYERYGARLLEKNVRAFLQVKGAVNKGIRKTILETPEMFLAYNNGISATAESLEVESGVGHYCLIHKLNDLQIVNGGQTTASIYNACLKSPMPLDNIMVQAKITVVYTPSALDLVVPKISKYANTQNKVQEADFYANDPYHRQLEELSRTVYTPMNGAMQSRWFYERAHGQYADERGHAHSTKRFDSEYPKSQFIDKVQVARYENVWNQLPYIAGKGGQANFRQFAQNLIENKTRLPTEKDFKRIIAKAILYRGIHSIVKEKELGFQGFWVNIADYTMAAIVFKTAYQINLDRLWEEQKLPDSWHDTIVSVAKIVDGYIRQSAGEQNISQWCKKEACWNGLKESSIDFGDLSAILDTGVEKGKTISRRGNTKVKPPASLSAKEEKLIEDISSLGSDFWFGVSAWGAKTETTQSWQNSIAFSMGKVLANTKYRDAHPVSIKQAKQGLKILKIVYKDGFDCRQEIADMLKNYKDFLKEKK